MAHELLGAAAMKLASALAFLLFGILGCSGDDPDVGASGFARDRSVASLSAEEASSLCDWTLAAQGGAGSATDCGGGRSRVTHTKERCVENLATMRQLSACYDVKVGELEDCAVASGRDACAEHPACDVPNERLEQCAGKD